MSGRLPEDWISRFPLLDGLPADLRERLRRGAAGVAAPAGMVLFRPGGSCEQFLMLIEGTVRVQMLSESGREIVLYRVAGGETCIMTTACLMTHADYGAEGVAETDILAASLPMGAFEELLSGSPLFRSFVFSSYGSRITDLLLLLEEVAFRRIDVRLAGWLAERASNGALNTTHQDIAVELGTAREVVSRQLKEFERRRWVELGRGRVSVLDPAALRDLAEVV